MKTVQAADTAVSIWISREEPPTGQALLELVRRALTERGLAPWTETEVECFAAGEDTLVIARPAHNRRPAFYFADLEALIAGVWAGGDRLDGAGALYAAADGYLLAVAEDNAAPALYEYGRAGSASAEWEVHAREQGRCIIEKDAAGVLRRHFSR